MGMNVVVYVTNYEPPAQCLIYMVCRSTPMRDRCSTMVAFYGVSQQNLPSTEHCHCVELDTR
eukprot:6204036-Pleurochrysis_carterae.AAC.4